MRRSTGMLILPTLVLLACTDTPPTASPTEEDLSLSNAVGSPCPTCAFGPRKFLPRLSDPFHATFIPQTAQTNNCTLSVQDDGDWRTSIQVWLNGPAVLPGSALLGRTRVLRVPVTLISGRNTIEVSVQGDGRHFVLVRIDCGDRVDIAPEQVQRSTGETQQFSVWGSPGPHTWSVNEVDGGNSTFGTIDAAGLYAAPTTVPTPATFPLCARVTATPTISKCATITIVPGPPASMQIWSGDGQAALASSPVLIPPAVLVTGTDGKPWPGVGVTFTVASGGGTVTGATTSTGTDGIATVGSWTLGTTPGPNTLTATAAESGIMGNPVTFTATGAALRGNTITAGGYHTCGIATDGKSYCWGRNDYGQIGYGRVGSSPEPTPVNGDFNFVSLTASVYRTCGLASGRVAYCWGRDNDGNPTLTPREVGGSVTLTTLTAGYAHTCGLDRTGTAYCWGENFSGQLGDGTTTSRSSPTAVAGGLTFVTLAASQYSHTCGLTSSGAAYCWGSNAFGQIGDGTTRDRWVPTAVAVGLSFNKLTLGYYYTCGLSNTGAAYCWGSNAVGQLGNGTHTDEVLPVRVHGGLIFTSLVAGNFHTCGLIAGGVAYCWGLGEHGQLGRGAGQPTETVPTAVVGGLTFRELAGGYIHTCGVASAGALYCWGANTYGELGDGTTTDRFVPTAVIGGLTFIGNPAS